MTERIEQLRSQLRELADEGDWAGVIERRERLVEVVEGVAAKIAELVALAELYRDELLDSASAGACFQRAIVLLGAEIEGLGLAPSANPATPSTAAVVGGPSAPTKATGEATRASTPALAGSGTADSPEAAAITPQGGMKLSARARLEDKGLSDNPAELRWEISDLRDRGLWLDAAKRMLKLLNLSTDPEELWRLHFDLGELYLEKLPDLEEARFHLQAAHDLSPSSKVTLDGLAALYRRLEDWAALIEVKLQLCDLVEISQELSRHYTEIGQLYAARLGEWNKALEFYNLALDKYPENQAPFQEMVRMLVERQSWTVLEQSYRRMLARIGDDPAHSAQRLTIGKALGKLLQSQLRSPERALLVYRVTQAEFPDDYWLQGSIAQTLADMSRLEPELLPEVIDQSRALIARNPAQAAGYQLLGGALSDSGRRDEAWVLSSVLYALGIANTSEQQLFGAHHLGMPEFDNMLQMSQLEQYLFTPLLRSPVASIFALVSDLFRRNVAPDTPRRYLKKKNRLRLDEHPMVEHCLKVVLSDAQVPMPEVYLDSETQGIRPFTTNPNCLLISEDWLRARTRGQLAYAIGAQCAMFLPQFYFIGIGPDVMANVIQAALVLSIPDYRGPETEELRLLVKVLDDLNHASREQLKAWCVELTRESAAIDFNEWSNDAERVAQRIGLLLCNEVGAALETINSPDFTVVVPRAELAHDLLVWAVSEEYFTLRQELGITIQQFTAPAW
ncbi:MAG: hypothetical protein KC609_26285 [Myxococcales bacterium]|nr:hypothetical protein [Myxococcales bacterium]